MYIIMQLLFGATNIPSLIAIVVTSRFFCSQMIEIIPVKTVILV